MEELEKRSDELIPLFDELRQRLFETTSMLEQLDNMPLPYAGEFTVSADFEIREIDS